MVQLLSSHILVSVLGTIYFGIVTALECEKPYVQREIVGQPVCCKAVECSPGYEIISCRRDLESERCSKCPFGFVQLFNISSYQDEANRQCMDESVEDCEAKGEGSIPKKTHIAGDICSNSCVCDISRLYVGRNPCDCKKCTRQEGNCSQEYYLHETKDFKCECTACPSGYEKNWIGPGPCKPVGPKTTQDPISDLTAGTPSPDPLDPMTDITPKIDRSTKKTEEDSITVIVLGICLACVFAFAVVMAVCWVFSCHRENRHALQTSHSMVSVLCKIIPNPIRRREHRSSSDNLDDNPSQSGIYQELSQSLPSRQTEITTSDALQTLRSEHSSLPRPPARNLILSVNRQCSIDIDPEETDKDESNDNTSPVITPGSANDKKQIAMVSPWQTQATDKIEQAPSLGNSSDIGSFTIYPPVPRFIPNERTAVKPVHQSQQTFPKQANVCAPHRIAPTVACTRQSDAATHNASNRAPNFSQVGGIVKRTPVSPITSPDAATTNLKTVAACSETDLKTVPAFSTDSGWESETDLKVLGAEENMLSRTNSHNSVNIHTGDKPVVKDTTGASNLSANNCIVKEAPCMVSESNNVAVLSELTSDCLKFPSLDTFSTEISENDSQVPMLTSDSLSVLSDETNETDFMLQ